LYFRDDVVELVQNVAGNSALQKQPAAIFGQILLNLEL
jgi:hypothetical protein